MSAQAGGQKRKGDGPRLLSLVVSLLTLVPNGFVASAAAQTFNAAHGITPAVAAGAAGAAAASVSAAPAALAPRAFRGEPLRRGAPNGGSDRLDPRRSLPRALPRSRPLRRGEDLRRRREESGVPGRRGRRAVPRGGAGPLRAHHRLERHEAGAGRCAEFPRAGLSRRSGRRPVRALPGGLARRDVLRAHHRPVQSVHAFHDLGRPRRRAHAPRRQHPRPDRQTRLHPGTRRHHDPRQPDRHEPAARLPPILGRPLHGRRSPTRHDGRLQAPGGRGAQEGDACRSGHGLQSHRAGHPI